MKKKYIVIYLIAIFVSVLDYTSEQVSNGMALLLFGIALIIAFGGYTIYSKLSNIKKRRKKEDTSPRARVLRGGNDKLLINERVRLVNAWDSLNNREKFFLSKDKDDRVREIYINTRNQMERYLIDAAEYLESYDFILEKNTNYLSNLCDEAETMLGRFNKMTELSVSLDDEVMSYDTSEIDDMIKALEELKDAGKDKLAR